jgi:hypothetical protein
MQTSLNRKPTREEAIKIQAYYRVHPEFFFKYFLGVEAWGKQLEIAHSIIHNRVTTVRSCHAAGKSYVAACIALWYLSAYPGSIVVTTAPTWRQVKDILWRNINTRYATAKIPLGGDAPNATGWQVSSNWFAIGVSSKDPDKIQGYHAESGHLLVICDEASGIEEPIFEGIDALLTGDKCRKLEIGNPTSSSGTFRDNHKPGAPTHKIRISAFDTPNFTANGIRNEEDLIEAIRDKLIPLSWIEAATTDERLEKVLGLQLSHPDILQVGEAKFEQIEAENDRIRKEALEQYMAAQNTVRGVDVARFGGDSTVITPRWGKVIGRQDAYHHADTMQTAGRVWPRIVNRPTDFTGVDVIGLGGGVVDRLHELQAEQEAKGIAQWAQVVGVNVANPPTEVPEGLPTMEFANKRAELYWTLREWFERGDIYLMPDEDGNPPEDLMDELSSIEYKYLGAKIYIEEKKDMKKRLHGKSPDHADSLMLTLARQETASWQPNDTAEEPEDDADYEPSSHGEEEGAWDDELAGAREY